MSKAKLITGIICCIVAALMFIFEETTLIFTFGKGRATIYPGIGFLILGVILIATSRRVQKSR